MNGMHSPFPPTSPYPPLANTWNRLRAWLSREYPELGDTLNWGVLPQDMADLELQFGFALPTVVRESYLCCDGQEAESAAGCSEGLFFGLTLLPLESVLEEWRFWREVDEDPTTGANAGLRSIQQSVPPNYVRKAYSERGWIPLVADKAGNYVGIDLNPGEAGTAGQVIVFGRDFDTKVVLWRGDGATGWAKWLDSFAEELESGEGFEIGNNDSSEDSEDDVGYDGYFYNGNAPGQGDSSATGTAGLRYTGEYRGWNVLEVWADRSFRRWLDAGLIPADALATTSADEESKIVREAAYPGTFTLTPYLQAVEEVVVPQESETVIPIPVLQSPSEEIRPPPPSHHRASSSKAQPSRTHRRSASKAPAPLPVELPTAQDIASVSSPSTPGSSTLDVDLEAGRSQQYEDVGLVSATRRLQRGGTTDSSDIPLSPPMSPPLRDDTQVSGEGTRSLDLLSGPIGDLPAAEPLTLVSSPKTTAMTISDPLNSASVDTSSASPVVSSPEKNDGSLAKTTQSEESRPNGTS